MTFARKYPMLGSSVDPDKISLTIKSVGLALIPLMIMVFRMFEVEVVENDLIQVINGLATIASMVGVIIGVGRKYIK